MLVFPVTSDDGPCPCVVACPRTRAAAVVDPDPALHAACLDLASSQGLDVRYALDTRTVGAESGRFRSLLSELGLRDAESRTPLGAPAFQADLDALPRVGPVRAWGGEPSRRVVVLEVGEAWIEVPVEPDEALGCFVVGDRTAELRLAWGRARVRLGDVLVDVLPSGVGTVAFHADGHLLAGTAVLAGTDLRHPHGTPASLLRLPPHTVVHGGVVVGGVGTSTVGAERRRSERLGGLRRRGPEPALRLVEDELPARPLDPRGFVAVAPAVAWAHLDRLTVIDLRHPREVAETLPGAVAVPMAGLQGHLADQDRDRPVLLVCESGLRSEAGAALVVRMGFRKVFHLTGGLELWRETALPLRSIHTLPTASNDAT